MKKHYKKIERWWRKNGGFAYEHVYAGYYRSIKTYPEVRENEYLDKHDEDVRYYKIKMRRCRMRKMLPDPWEDFYCEKKLVRSWKVYSKNRKQWQ